jgi:hypothetical protein
MIDFNHRSFALLTRGLFSLINIYRMSYYINGYKDVMA